MVVFLFFTEINKLCAINVQNDVFAYPLRQQSKPVGAGERRWPWAERCRPYDMINVWRKKNKSLTALHYRKISEVLLVKEKPWPNKVPGN